jgi:hypothetical protein
VAADVQRRDREIRPSITNIVLNIMLARAGSHLFPPTRREEARGGHQSIWNRELPPEVPPDALAQCEMGQHNREPRLTKNRTKSLKRIRHLNAAAMNGQWTSVSQMSQSYVTGQAWHSGDHMDFSPPHRLRRCWSAGFFIAARRKNSLRFQGSGAKCRQENPKNRDDDCHSDDCRPEFFWRFLLIHSHRL